MDIAGPDHGDIFGNSKPGFGNGSHGANRNRVVIAENTIRQRLGLQQPVHSFMARLILVTSFHDVTCRHRQPAFYQRPPVPFHASGGDADSRTAQMGNSLAATLDEMSRSQLADSFIVDSDEAGLHPAMGRSIKTSGTFRLQDLFEGAGSRLRRRQDQTVHLSSQ